MKKASLVGLLLALCLSLAACELPFDLPFDLPLGDQNDNALYAMLEYFQNGYPRRIGWKRLLLHGVLAGRSESEQSHMMNQNGEFAFVTFIFHDVSKGTVNASQALYPGYQQGGIINAADLPKDGSVDTTHEYIMLEVKLGNSAEFGPFAGMSLGYALLYNHNYVAK